MKKAFSIAEAFIMLTVVSVALAAAAPMITKQIKHNNLSNVQTNLLGREINQAENRINVTNANIQDIIGAGRTPASYAQYIQSLENRIAELQNILNLNGQDYEQGMAMLQEQLNNQALSINGKADNTALRNLENNMIDVNNDIDELNNEVDALERNMIPSGAIMFFDLARCPSGWTALNSGGAFIRDVGGYAANRGVSQAAGVPNLKGWVTAGNDQAGDGTLFKVTSTYAGASKKGSSDLSVDFDASRYSSVYKNDLKEVRPKNIAYLACRKN